MNKRKADRKALEHLIPPVLEKMAGETPVPPEEWEEIQARIRREHPDAETAAGRLLPWPETRVPLFARLAAGAAMIASMLFLSLISLFPHTPGAPFLPGRDLTVGRLLDSTAPVLEKFEKIIDTGFPAENRQGGNSHE